MPRFMLDAVDGNNIPAGTLLMAGYNDHSGLSYNVMKARFPDAIVVPICVDPAHDATILDVERFDARPDQVPAWVIRQRVRGQEPTVYCSMSAWPAVKAAVGNMRPPQYWIADYNLEATVIPGAVGHQFRDAGPYDVSVMADYWPGVDPPLAPPRPAPDPASGDTDDEGEPIMATLIFKVNDGPAATQLWALFADSRYVGLQEQSDITALVAGGAINCTGSPISGGLHAELLAAAINGGRGNAAAVT